MMAVRVFGPISTPVPWAWFSAMESSGFAMPWRYSGFHATICTTLSEIGWKAGYGKCWGVEATEMTESDLIVIWGGNPVSTQVNVMTHRNARAQTKWRKAGGHRSLSHRHCGTSRYSSRPSPRHGWGARLRGHAYPVPRTAMPIGTISHGMLIMLPNSKKHLEAKTPAWAAAITGLSVDEIEDFTVLYGKNQALLYPFWLRVYPVA